MYQPVLHYHRCRACEKDCICATLDCKYRATDSERVWCCFLCQDAARDLLAQFTEGEKHHENAQPARRGSVYSSTRN